MTRRSHRVVMALVVAALLASPALRPAAGAVDEARPGAALVRIPFPQDDGSLTPYSFELGYPLLTLVYDTLMWRDAQGVPRPWLARSVERSSDGLSVVVRLAPGVRWHDGAPLTAADVVFTFDFVSDHAHPRFTGELGAVQEVTAPDAETVVVTLRHPSPGFPDQPLADLPILPRHLWEGRPAEYPAPEGLPVGSGPYRLVAYQPGEGYRFEANSGYFRGRPTVDAIEVPVVRTAEETLQALEQRRVDVVPASLPDDLASRVRSLGVRVVDGRSFAGLVLAFNMRAAPFDRIDARQAVARSLDLDAMARDLGQGAVAATGGYLHPASHFAPDEELQAFDPEGARRALADVKLRDLEVLVADNDPRKRVAARQIVAGLSRAGVVARMTELSPTELSEALGESGKTPTFQAAVVGSSALASYDPDFLKRVFGSDPEIGTFNVAGYRAAAFDMVAERIATTQAPAARRQQVGEALRLLAFDVPVVPLVFPGGAFAYRPGTYDGWVVIEGSGILDKRSFLEPTPAPASVAVTPSANGRPFPLGLVAVALLVIGLGLGSMAWARSR